MARGQAKKTQEQARERTQPKTRTARMQPKAGPQALQEQLKEQANEVVLAMDIGTRSIIGMVGVVEDGKVKIIAMEKEEHTERAMIDGQIENIEKVSALAGKVKKRLEDKTGIRLSRVCVAAAGRALRTKRAEYELELSSSQLIDDEIISRLEAGAITRAEEAFDAENEAAEDSRRFYLVGYTVCQYFLDQYVISNLKDHRGKQVKVDLIATFLPSEVVESLYTTMSKIGLEVASLTLEPIAAINAAIPENIRLLNLVLVDIGAGTSDIAACTGGSVTGYTMATVAGDEITETIMKQYLVDFSTAEGIKARLETEEEISFKDILGMDYRVSRDEIFQCIQGTSGFLCKEIADKVMEVNGSAPSALFLAGGGSKLAGLKEGLTTALGMAPGRVAIAGNYFNANAFSDEYDLNNPEFATPLGIAVSSGLNMINDSFRVILNNKPAKLFRSGSFTALNLLMMNGYNFRDLLGRAGQNLTVTVNGARKIFYGSASEPATLLINQKEGKLSDIIHAGDAIDFVPAVPGIAAKACLGDIEGAADCVDITLNGIHVPLKAPLKSGDVIHMILPKKVEGKSEETAEEESRGRASGEGSGTGDGTGMGIGTGGRREKGAESGREKEVEKTSEGAEETETALTETDEGAGAVRPELERDDMLGAAAAAEERESERVGAGGKAEELERTAAGERAARPAAEEMRPGLGVMERSQPDQPERAWAGGKAEGLERAAAYARAAEPGQAAADGKAEDPDQAAGGRRAAEPGQAAAYKRAEEPGRTAAYAGSAEPGRAAAYGKAAELGQAAAHGRAEGSEPAAAGGRAAEVSMTEGILEKENPGVVETRASGTALERLGRFGAKITPMMGAESAANLAQAEEESSRVQGDVSRAEILNEERGKEARKEGGMDLKSTLVFRLNGASIELPKKEDGRPYYLMDMIQYSGIDLERPRGVVKLTVNGIPGMFQQTLREGDVVCIEEELR